MSEGVCVRVSVCVCVTRMWRHFQLLKIQRLYILLSCVLSFSAFRSFWAKTLALCNIFTSRLQEGNREGDGRKRGAERGMCRQPKLLIAQTHTHIREYLGLLTHTHIEKTERSNGHA